MSDVKIQSGTRTIAATLELSDAARGIVVFAHGSGSSRFSPRNRQVAAALRQAGFATLLLDLLTPEEEREDEVTTELRFNIPLLAERLVSATGWVRSQAHI